MEVADLKNKELYIGCKEFEVKRLYVLDLWFRGILCKIVIWIFW